VLRFLVWGELGILKASATSARSVTTPTKPFVLHELEFSLAAIKKSEPFLTGRDGVWNLTIRNLKPVERKVRIPFFVETGSGTQRAAADKDYSGTIGPSATQTFPLRVPGLVMPGDATINVVETPVPFDRLTPLNDAEFRTLVNHTKQTVPGATHILGTFRVRDAEAYATDHRRFLLVAIFAGIAAVAAVVSVVLTLIYH